MNANNIWNRDAAKMIEANKNSDFFFLPSLFFLLFPEESDTERGKHNFPSCQGRKTFCFEGSLLKYVMKIFWFSSFKTNSPKNLVSSFLPSPTPNTQHLFSPFLLNLSLVRSFVVCYHNKWMKRTSAKYNTEKFKKKLNFTSWAKSAFYISPQFNAITAKVEELWFFK